MKEGWRATEKLARYSNFLARNRYILYLVFFWRYDQNNYRISEPVDQYAPIYFLINHSSEMSASSRKNTAFKLISG